MVPFAYEVILAILLRREFLVALLHRPNARLMICVTS